MKQIEIVAWIYSAYITFLHLWSSQRDMERCIKQWRQIHELEDELRRQKMLRRLGTPWSSAEEENE